MPDSSTWKAKVEGVDVPHSPLHSGRSIGMTVFDEVDRADLHLATYGEGNFSFLNRSSRPEFVAARRMIEDWFSRYPPDAQAELASRFRDKNTPQSFDSAFYELFLHEFFIRGGCSVEVHPQSSGSRKPPDFLITTPASRLLYLEAIVASGITKEERAIHTRTHDLYNALNQVVCPDFFINVWHYNFQPSTPIPISKVRREIQRWIDGLDYEEVMAIPKRDSFDDLPSHFIEHEGNTAKLVAIPKKRECRGLPDVPTVGGHSGDVVCVHTHEDIRSAVKKKRASRYDLGGIPYVVAVRCPDALTRPMDVERALFGLASSDRERDLGSQAVSDLEDGIWAGMRGATNRSISGVLSVWDPIPGVSSRQRSASTRILGPRDPWMLKNWPLRMPG